MAKVQSIDSVVRAFDSFVPSGDEYADTEALEKIIEAWQKLPKKERPRAFGAMLGVFERNPDNAELGMPGPIVHAMEAEDGYEADLVASMKRKPSYYAAWMVNRLLNDDPPKAKRDELLGLLKDAARNKKVSSDLRDAIKEFVEEQAG